MAQKVEVILVDDIDGSKAGETIQFGLDGATYEIDLNTAHATALRNALASFVRASRKVSISTGRTSSAKRRKALHADLDNAEVRSWARANGVKINDRGRIPATVIARFQEVRGVT